MPPAADEAKDGRGGDVEFEALEGTGEPVAGDLPEDAEPHALAPVRADRGEDFDGFEVGILGVSGEELAPRAGGVDGDCDSGGDRAVAEDLDQD